MQIVHVPSDFRRHAGLGALGQTGVSLKDRMIKASSEAFAEYNQKKSAVLNKLKVDHAVEPRPLRWFECMENAGPADVRFNDNFDGDWEQDVPGDKLATSLHAARFCGRTAEFMHELLMDYNYRQITEIVQGVDTKFYHWATRPQRLAVRWAAWLILKCPDAFNKEIFSKLDKRKLAQKAQDYWGDAEDFYWGRLFCYGQAYIGKALARSLESGFVPRDDKGELKMGTYPFKVDESVYFFSSMDKICDPGRQPEWYEEWGSVAIAGLAAGAAAGIAGILAASGGTAAAGAAGAAVAGKAVAATLVGLGPVGWLVLAGAAAVAAGIFAFFAVKKMFRENPEFSPGERSIEDDYAYGIMLWSMLLRGWKDPDERNAFKQEFLTQGYSESMFNQTIGDGRYIDSSKNDYYGQNGPFGWVPVYIRNSEVCPDGFIKVGPPGSNNRCPEREFGGSKCPIPSGKQFPKPCGGTGSGFCGDKNLLCVEGCCEYAPNYVSNDMKGDLADRSKYIVPDPTNRNLAIMATIGVVVVAGAYLLGRKV